MPATVSVPRKYRTKQEWLDLAAAVDRDLVPSPKLLADLQADALRIIDQCVERCKTAAEWVDAVGVFSDAMDRLAQRHQSSGGPSNVPKNPAAGP